jgi:hypothetical protein
MLELPPGDILVKGYLCEGPGWEKAYKEDSRKVFVYSYMKDIGVERTEVYFCACYEDQNTCE